MTAVERIYIWEQIFGLQWVVFGVRLLFDLIYDCIKAHVMNEIQKFDAKCEYIFDVKIQITRTQ